MCVLHKHWRHAVFFGYTGVVRTKSRRNMHDTSTVIGGNKVACNHAESLVGILGRSAPRNELLVSSAYEVCAFAFPYNLIRDSLAFRRISCQSSCIALYKLFAELFCQKRFADDDCYRLKSILIVCFYEYILNLFAHGKCGVRRQCPRGSRPSKDMNKCCRVTQCFTCRCC